jgi:hypothetical protein
LIQLHPAKGKKENESKYWLCYAIILTDITFVTYDSTMCYYSEICLNWILNKLKLYINQGLNKVTSQKILNVTCLNRTPVYSEHKSWSQGGLV